MKNSYIIKSIFIFLIALQFSAYAQDSPKKITVSKIVGDVIDAEEKLNFGLFNEYSDDEFKEAKFFKNPDNSRFLVIYLNNGAENKKTLTENEYYAYKKQIEKRKINYNEIDSTVYCVIKLMDESSISGKVISVYETEIEVDTKYLGKINIFKKDILEIIVLNSDGKQANKFWLPNPHDSRHLFAPTARNLSKGEAYFQDIYLILLNANYGLTDYLTIGGGCSIIPGFGIDEQAYLLNVKFGFDFGEKFSLGSGILYGNLPSFDEYGIAEELTVPILNANPPRDTTVIDTSYYNETYRINTGIAFAVATYGNRENNLTFGMGYAYIEGIKVKNPIYMLGGMCRLSRKSALVTENWLFFQEYEGETFASPIISYGVRFFGEKMSLDFAFLQIPGEKMLDQLIFPGIPYVDFVLKF